MRRFTTLTALPPALALALAACAPAPGPAPVATPTPTAAASAGPAAGPSAAATPAPTPPSTARPGAAVAGTVLDLDGAPVAGATVTATSLVASAPFTATATTDAAGRYALAGLPLATDLAIAATRPGLTARRQVRAFAADGTVDFGGEGEGAAFFLADPPEIAETRPAGPTDAPIAEGEALRYALVLSEPLPDGDRRRFEDALRLMPADDEPELTRRYPLDRAAEIGPYAVAAGDRLYDGAGVAARVTWSADGLVATLAFDGLARGRSARRWRAVLRAGDAPIRDAAGHALGTAPSGGFDGWPAAGGLVPGAFYNRRAAIAPVEGLAAGTPAARWAATHDADAGFRVAADTRPPRLVDADVERAGSATRIVLRFDEPLVAYDGTDAGLRGAGLGAAAADLAGLTFATSERDDTPARLDGEDPAAIDPRAMAAIGREAEFAFDPAAFAPRLAGAAEGAVVLGPDPDDPKALVLTIRGRSRFFGPDAARLTIRAEGVGDPAGRVRDEEDADADILTIDL